MSGSTREEKREKEMVIVLIEWCINDQRKYEEEQEDECLLIGQVKLAVGRLRIFDYRNDEEEKDKQSIIVCIVDREKVNRAIKKKKQTLRKCLF